MSRFQIGCLELRCSKYRQMSGGFLFGLQEMQVSERSLSTMSLLKASMNVWNEYITPDADDESMWNEFEHDLKLSESDIDSCMLDEERVKVITVIAGYIATQTNKTTNCDLCQELSTRNTGNLSSNDCLNKLSRRGCLKHVLKHEYVLNCKNACPDVFLCNNHKDVRSRIHRLLAICISYRAVPSTIWLIFSEFLIFCRLIF